MKRTTTLIVALVASAGLALAGCGGGDKKKDDKPAPKAGDTKTGAADTKKADEKTATTITFKCTNADCGKSRSAPKGSTQKC